ncbi:LysR family transcriptional regulator [Radicibacter daui]|uniref:LysR family transcriptional regulator n=1 Tax=Radicibacter daui TaxID=3064829 RepID=UPI004046FFFB
MLDRFLGMEVFARVAALGGISAAARSLRMSPTMATKYLAALEERLGVKLLHRTTRRLTLTEAGRRFLDGAERILAEVEEVEAAASAERVELRGNLRVNAPVSFGTRQIAPLMAGFAEQYPHLRVELGLNDRVIDLTEEGWDLAIRVSQRDNRGLSARLLAPCNLALCAAPAYLARRGAPRTVADLADHECLGYTLSPTLGAREWWFGTKGDIRTAISGSLIASNGDALMEGAVAGLGIIYQPTFIVGDALRDGRLVALTLDHPVRVISGVMALYPERRQTAKVAAFVNFLMAAYGTASGALPPWDRELPVAD